MKVSKGRGIQFFKHSAFVVPGRFVVNTYNASKNKISGFVTKGKKK
jgi:hypothetical protein